MFQIAPNAIVRREFFGGLGILINVADFELDEATTSLLRCLKHTTDTEVIARVMNEVHQLTLTSTEVEGLYTEALESGLVVASSEQRQMDGTELARLMRAELEDVRQLDHLSAPLNISIYPGMKCNLACKFCFVSQEKWDDDKIVRPLEDWIPVLDEIKAMEIPYLTILGGEPLMYPDIWRMLDYLDSIGQKTHVTTNGTIVTEELIAELKKHPDLTLKVSVQALNEKHNLLTKGSLTRTLHFIEKIREAGVECGIHMVGLPENLDQAPLLADYAADKGLYEFSMGVFFNINQVDLQEFSLEQYREIHQEMKEYIEQKHGERIRYRLEGCQLWTAEPTMNWETLPNTPFGILRTGCEAAQARAEIMNDGTVLACALFDKHTHGAGNVFQDSFRKIWRESATLSELRGLKTEDTACGSCQFEYFCHGGCPALNYKKTGNMRAGDDRCRIRTHIVNGWELPVIVE
jgi:KxxxW cyclic peptide radical SAM maturase